MEGNVLLSALQDMEEAMQQMQTKLLFLKRTTQNMERPIHGANDVSNQKRLGKIDGVADSQANKVVDTVARKSECGWAFELGDEDEHIQTVVEPANLLLRRQGKECLPSKRRTVSQMYIQAPSFGQSGGQAAELHMNPEWMELASKGYRALESAAALDDSGRSSSLALFGTCSRVVSKPTLDSGDTAETEATRLASRCFCMHSLSPHAPVRIAWDVVGFLFLVVDVLSLPVVLAWDFDAGTVMLVLNSASICFWSIDIVMNFNTGFYSEGVLDRDRRRIATNYLSGWFPFDMFIVCLDILLAVKPSGHSEATSAVRSARGLRALRAARLLRLMKTAKINAIIEEVAVSSSRPWILMVVSMMKTLFIMIGITHILSCLWFYIGRAVSSSGRTSWLDAVGAQDVSASVQYLHALQWLLTPPAPAPLEPRSGRERLFNIIIVILTLVVMGSALGKFTSALQDLSVIYAERSRKRREVRSYLQGQAISVELIARIMRFVDYKLSLQDAGAALDVSLISPTLQMELYVNQRSSVLETHPLLNFINELDPQTFGQICGAVVKNIFEKAETIFQAGQFATQMIITSEGDYTLLDVSSEEEKGKQFSGVRWFAESSMFVDSTIHRLTLRADTFCDVFTLTGKVLQFALQGSPGCTYMVCEYAKDLLAELKRCPDPFDDALAVSACRKAVKQNNFYMDLYPDPNTVIENYKKSLTSGNSFQARSIPDFIQDVLSGKISDQDDLATRLQEQFFELDTEDGAHVVFSQKGERERAESSCLSILNLLSNQYENFIEPQDPHLCLTWEQWQALQDILQWIAPTRTQVHGVLVLMVIRSLGKSKRLVQQLPQSCRRPEVAVIHLISHVHNVVPSVIELDEDTKDLLIETLRVHEDFNFAQLLQGENCPANIGQLQEMIRDNTSLLKFYMLFVIGFMSGLAGGKGSRFLTSKAVGSIIMGCHALRYLMVATPQAIFWSYLIDRGGSLGVSTVSLEELALVRLSCLSRVQDHAQYLKLRNAWMNVPLKCREVLMNNFLADGITERAFVLEFLPLCIRNATDNPVVRLAALLEVVANLLENLAPSINIMANIPQCTMMVIVDLSDMADFIAVVKNRFVFQSCIMRSKVRLIGLRIFLEMSSSNWTRTSDADSDTSALAHDVKQVLGKLELLETRGSSPKAADRNLEPELVPAPSAPEWRYSWRPASSHRIKL